MDVWELNERISRVPPIVLLSACDTHAADRNHATTGNAFLALGARSVLASVFPLDAREAAVFFGRLLLRVAVYLPLAARILRRPIRWNELVSGMLQMQLVTDFLRHLEARGAINEQTLRSVHYKANEAINGGEVPPESDPFRFVTEHLQSLGLQPDYIRSNLETAIANSSTISYLQLGRPETILIQDPTVLEGLTDLIRDPQIGAPI